ncbi:MAG: hypothetical protein MJY72_08320 [Bacteroidales bacterium]|nr:hypothetical protein [Bacteroidales bacterium]
MNIKKIMSILAAISMLVMACKPDDPTPRPEPEPDPDPVVPDEPGFVQQDDVIYLLSDKGVVEKEIKVASTACYSDTGFYAFYLADFPGLSKEVIKKGLELDLEKDNIIAVNILSPLNGQPVDVKLEHLRYLISTLIPGVVTFDSSNETPTDEIMYGVFTLSVDKEAKTASFEIEIKLIDRRTILVKTTSEYTPGGENESTFLWGEDYSRPVRAAFYRTSDEYVDVMYFTTGGIEYGEDIPKTTYAMIAPKAEICDGQFHSIADCLADGTLQMMVRDFDSEWDMVSGSLAVEIKGEHDYCVTVSGAKASDRNGYTSVQNGLDMYWNGPLLDASIERPVDNAFFVGKTRHAIGTALIDLSGALAHIYWTEAEGVTTVAEAEAADHVRMTVSKQNYNRSAGLSTDGAFSLSYDGKTWDKTNLDTGSYIVHSLNEETGLYHSELANLWPLSGSSVVLKLEYKGNVVIIR